MMLRFVGGVHAQFRASVCEREEGADNTFWKAEKMRFRCSTIGTRKFFEFCPLILDTINMPNPCRSFLSLSRDVTHSATHQGHFRGLPTSPFVPNQKCSTVTIVMQRGDSALTYPG